MPKFDFPDNFLWGAATSSYQIEGQNKDNDWFLWEEERKTSFRCGKAVDSYNRFEEDFDLVKSLGHNAHRLSFEWSRIQPHPGKFSEKELGHYRQVISSLLERNIKPIVALHHFTNPSWLYLDGGWLNPLSSSYFSQYVERVVKEFSDCVSWWITINEPLVYMYNSYLKGIWPPGQKSLRKAFLVLDNLKKAHLKSYAIIHEKCKDAKVSIAKHMRVFSPCFKFNFGQNLMPAYLRNKIFNFDILDYFAKQKVLDFIGLNYYTKDFIKGSLKNAFGRDCISSHHRMRRNSLGWYVSPKSMFKILMRLKKYNLPVIIAENGTSENEDRLYEEYLIEHLRSTAEAIKKGVDVRGYFWWSLLDNFEWHEGFKARFGLAEVDSDFNRKVRNFAYIFRDICVNNRLKVL
ncbi:MAG: glycoside hydrolase family 1 protein [Candidatus Omnitrophica bacterium]|nr:glycoside hydrolase family 1 protein [Candidatus Omnitrophota bacterium]